jgi:hypothetical protein
LKGPGADYEASVLLYTPAVWQIAYAAKSAFRPTVSCIRSILYEGRQKADAAAGDYLLIRETLARINIGLCCMDIVRSFTMKASMNKPSSMHWSTSGSELFTNAERAALDYVMELLHSIK